MANLEVVNRTLALTPRGNIGDVLTIIDAQTIEFAPGAGITGVNLQNGGVPLAGGPFTTVNGIGGGFVNSGAGVAAYTPPAPPASGWIMVSKSVDQPTTSTVPINDTVLVTPALAPGKYRFRINIWYSAVGAGGFDANVLLPTNTFLLGRLIAQDAGSGSLGTGGNIGATVPAHSTGNTGNGWLYYEGIIVVSVAGVIQLQFDAQNGGNTATVYAGSYLEYEAD